MVPDFFDFSIYIDADEKLIHHWYVERFMRLRQTAFRDPSSYFNRYATIDEQRALSIAEGLWQNINLKNLRQNILPTRPRADLSCAKQQPSGGNGGAQETLSVQGDDLTSVSRLYLPRAKSRWPTARNASNAAAGCPMASF